MSLIVADKKYSEIEDAWLCENIAELDEVKLVDTYSLMGVLSITVRFFFSSPDRTLSTEEIQRIMDKIIANLEQKDVKLRA